MFKDELKYYLVTELCDSGDLSNLIQKNVGMDESQAMKILN